MNWKLYIEASKVLKKLENKQGSLKSLIFTQSHMPNGKKKKIYAVVAQTLKYKEIILEVMHSCEILKKEPKISFHLCLVLLYDMLFGKGIQCGGPWKKAMNKHKVEILRCLEEAKHKTKPQVTQKVVLPKYGRVNLLKSTFDNAVQMLVQSGFTLHNWEHVIHLCKACTAAESQPLMSEISRPTTCDHSCFAQDPHVPDLLVFCPSAHLLEHPLYTSGRIMLQDKVRTMNWKLYIEASKVLKKLENKQGSLKSLIFTQSHMPNGKKKKIYAVVAQTLKYKEIILEVMHSCEILKKEPKISFHLCLVLLYDMLFGKGIQCGGPWKKAMNKHKVEILRCLEEAKHKTKPQVTQKVVLPKYGRVNLLKSTFDNAVQMLVQSGFTLHNWEHVIHLCKACTAAESQPLMSEISRPTTCDHSCFAQDPHVPDLLVFCPSAHLLEHPLYTSGRIMLQDKASCLPAYLLSPIAGSHVIDACAAPGNKTTHLASIMGDQGCVYAFDKDEQRFLSLKAMITKSGSSCVKALLKDFLQTNPSEYGSVQYILVDPSCSGSGIVSRVDFSNETTNNDTRLMRLSAFQKRILKHALNFPSVQRVVYSTCSKYKEENEFVVENALEEFGSSFELQHVLPQWEQRGLPLFGGANHCIRVHPGRHFTCGFFVAVFQRKDSSTMFSPKDTDALCRQNLPIPCTTHKTQPKSSKANRRRKYKPIKSSR